VKIGELASRTDATVKAIRHYESLGLITAARRTNGYRDFDEEAVRLVREIRLLGRLGIPAARTRPFLECLSHGGERADDCASSLAGYREAIEDLTVRIESLVQRRLALQRRLRDAAYRNSTAVPQPPFDAYRPPTDGPQPHDGSADHLVGRRLPPIELPSTGERKVNLAGVGHRRAVLYIYPLTGRPDMDLPEGWDNIPGARGCTAEACGFRDHHAELTAAGVTAVFGLSSQDVDYQREVVDRLALPYEMLSDPEFRLADALRLPTFRVGVLRLYRRLTLIVTGGVIERVYYPVLLPDQHAVDVLHWLHGNPVPAVTAVGP
jgi:peroxiredoxin/DNA-binding transcriptional MerR regulator